MSPAPHPRVSDLDKHPIIIDIRQNLTPQPKSDIESKNNNMDEESSGDEKENKTPCQGVKGTSNFQSQELTNMEEATCEEPIPTKQQDSSNSSASNGNEVTDFSLKLADSIIRGLTPDEGVAKSIPTMVLYDDKGLQIYDQITYLEEYYLVQEEIDILERDSDDIVDLIPDNSVIVELGSGSLRKTRLLLDAIEKKRQNVRYFALDLMRDELTKSLVSLGGYKNVTTAGLWGTYDEGMEFISSFPPDVPKMILWLGSSIGNMTRAEARDFITNYRQSLNVGDTWLIGIDRRNSPEEITPAYNDSQSVTREFIMNGLDHVNFLLRQPLFDQSKFDYYGRYNEEIGRHEAYYRSMETQNLSYTGKNGTHVEIRLEKDELINVEYSYKWSLDESAQLFQDTKMAKVGHWTSPRQRYDLHMLRKVPFFFSNGPGPVPAFASTEAWEELWKAWNLVTMEMIHHPEMLMEKPIDLRHPFIFYIGHIPTFLDIQLSKVCNKPFTEPSYFTEIFERGIDPDVEDPSKCHQHSDVPDTWPEVSEILSYRDEVVARLYRVLSDPFKYPMTRRMGRILFVAFEHQAMHLETLLYMLVQSLNTKPPPAISVPWAGISPNSIKIQGPLPPVDWITINPKELSLDILSLGHDDLEMADEEQGANLDTPFGWDNEHPRVQPPEIPEQFQIQSRQVTNGEYLGFLESTNKVGAMNMPKSWIYENGNIFVRSVFGKVAMSVAYAWPVCCSAKDALAYTTWMDPSGKTLSLPSEHQLSIAFKLKQGSGHGLLNCNYGFKTWFPLPSLAPHPVGSSQWDLFQGPGALWDWTSTPFGPLSPGFVASQIYPGYSADFFDGKHSVILGGSWATHPAIAERRSFRNWYQGNYDYAFTGFRLVKKCGETEIQK